MWPLVQLPQGTRLKLKAERGSTHLWNLSTWNLEAGDSGVPRLNKGFEASLHETLSQNAKTKTKACPQIKLWLPPHPTAHPTAFSMVERAAASLQTARADATHDHPRLHTADQPISWP